MKSDVFSQDNQSVGNNMPTDNLNTGGVNTPKELNDNNDGSVPAVENAASSDLNSANEALNSESVINSEVIGVTNNENENLNNLSGEESLPPENNLNNTKNRKKIFQRFYREDTSHSSKIKGSGLGLAIVKAEVDKYHGQIKVTDNAPKGTVFTVSLPLEK